MRISIYTGNHGNAHGITDLVCMLRNAIRDCGYDVCVSHKVQPNHCNILIENFEKSEHLVELTKARTPGTKYVLISSEIITNGSFNVGMDKSHWHYSNADYWRRRYEGFLTAAALSDAVWVLSENVVDSHIAALPGKPVRFLPHGYVEDFGQVQHRAESDKDIDFYFSGSMTEHRLAILQALARNHHVVFNEQATPDYLRLDLMARTKVCLSIRLSPQNELPSVSRMHFHLQNRNYLIHETYAKTSPLCPYVLHAPTEDFVDWAVAALDVTNRREVAESALSRFKAGMPMTRWMRPMLAEVVGDVERLRPAQQRHAA